MKNGISTLEFAALFAQSTLYLNRKIKWFTFHGAVDAAYFVKLINPCIKSSEHLKTLINEHMSIVYDLKRLRGSSLDALA